MESHREVESRWQLWGPWALMTSAHWKLPMTWQAQGRRIKTPVNMHLVGGTDIFRLLDPVLGSGCGVTAAGRLAPLHP